MRTTQKEVRTTGLKFSNGSTESRKKLELKFIFQLGTLSLQEINERLIYSQIHVTIFPPMAKLLYILT